MGESFHCNLDMHMLHQIKTPQFYTNFLKLISLVMDSNISEVEFVEF